MVKGYDPTVNDPSKIVLQYLMRWTLTPNSLTLKEAEKYTKYWLKNSQSTSKIYKRFEDLGGEGKKEDKPEIVLRKKCSDWLNWSHWKMMMPNNLSSDENFPAYREDNKIIVCLNKITNKTELKQNIDRQLTIFLKQEQRNQQNSTQQVKSIKSIAKQQKKSILLHQETKVQNKLQQQDKQLMQFIYEGCRQGYKNYMLEKQLEDRIAKKCAKYLFFRRCQRQLPIDAKFRYSSKVLQEVI